MSSNDDEPFLGRWSRRKHAARRGEALPEPAPAEEPADTATPAAGSAGARTDAPAPELPPIDSLQGLESEYREFLRPDVDPATRSAALKKLFGDPHFNRMDGLDVYIDDYSKADPIPAAMLQALNQARSLGLFEEEKKTEPAAGEVHPAPTQPGPAPIAPPEPPADSTVQSPTDPPPKTSGA